MNLGGPELLIILLIVGGLILPLWGIADAAIRPEAAWRRAGQQRGLWIALQAGGLLLCGLGAVIATLLYMTLIRPQVISAQAQSGPQNPPPPPF